MTSSDSEFPIAATFSGPVRGKRENDLIVFRGIRYGAAPSGRDRFRPSRRPVPWREPFDAFEFGASAIQMPLGIAEFSGSSPISEALSPILPSADDKAHASEDCLFLNVWTPRLNGAKRPVMIWLHGGGFAAGSARWPVYDGATLAREGDIVVVSLHHRLNVFGFLYLGDLAGGQYLQSGNAGMLDIMLAIWWVRDNIAHFGGDPNNVTVFGESGGGLKVSTLLAMRSARGLVHKAIIQSGPGVRCLTRETATQNAKAILAELDLELPRDLEKLLDTPASDLASAAARAQEKARTAGRTLWLSPVVDAMTIGEHPFEPVATAMAAKIPLLIGHTRDEGTFFIASEKAFGSFTRDEARARAISMAGKKADALIAAAEHYRPAAAGTELLADVWTFTWAFSGTVTIAERKAAQEPPVFVYLLMWKTPVAGGVLGATHALDVPLVFGTIEAGRPLMGTGSAPAVLSARMRAAWIAFARTGIPSCPDLPDWPPYDQKRRATMIFDENCRVEDDPFRDVRTVLCS